MVCAYGVANVFICLNVLLIFVIGIVGFVSKLFIDGMCVVALAPTTKIIIWAMVHPLVVMLLMRA
jgi:hypothetical protein